MTVYVADTHAHVQRLVSVVKMATVLEHCTIEEKHSVARFFLWAKGLNAKDVIKMGSVCHVKRFTAGWQRFR
jgi:hypothetical protein